LAPASSAYAYVGDKPTAFIDPSGAKGGNPDHDDAEILALDQLDPRYGPLNVYTDAMPERPSLPGRPRLGPGNTICVPTADPKPGEPATSCPDIIVGLGASTLVYEVKPGSDQLSPIRPNLPDRGIANASQVDRYIRSLALAGYPNVQAGPDIVPDSKEYDDGSVLWIFSGADWNTYAQKGKRPAANYSGIIYYNKIRPAPVPRPTGRPTTAPTEEPTEEPTQQPTQQPTGEPVPNQLGQEVERVLVDALKIIAVIIAIIIVAILLAFLVAAIVTLLGPLLAVLLA
jgi:hypothetical protein